MTVPPVPLNERASVAQKLLAVMQSVGVIEKLQTNQHQRYKFRGIDDLMAALQPALIEHGVVIVQRTVDMQFENYTQKDKLQTRVYVTVEFDIIDAETGAQITGRSTGEAGDTSDKALNKAETAAFKYFLFRTLCIPTEEQKDADAESPVVTYITSAQAKELRDMTNHDDADVQKSIRSAVGDRFRDQFGSKSADKVPAESFDDAKAIIAEVRHDQLGE